MTSQTPSPPNQQDAIAESANTKPAISRDIQRVVRALDAGDDFAYFESRRISERDDVRIDGGRPESVATSTQTVGPGYAFESNHVFH